MQVPKSFMQMFEPLLDFHQQTKGISRDDVRIYWDIHVLRGENELFARSKGTSTLPGMLSPKLKANAAAAMQQEVVDKIAQPLIAACMTEAEDQNADGIKLLADSGMTNTPPPPPHGSTGVPFNGGGDQMADLANQAAAAAGDNQDQKEVDEA